VGFKTPEEAVLSGYPAGEVCILGTPARSPDDAWAVVAFQLLAGDGRYETSVCERSGACWQERTSGSASMAPLWGWSATQTTSEEEHGLGVVFWIGTAAGDASEAAVTFNDHELRFPVVAGFYVGAIWNVPSDEAGPR